MTTADKGINKQAAPVSTPQPDPSQEWIRAINAELANLRTWANKLAKENEQLRAVSPSPTPEPPLEELLRKSVELFGSINMNLQSTETWSDHVTKMLAGVSMSATPPPDFVSSAIEAMRDIESKIVAFEAGQINWRPDDFLYRIRKVLSESRPVSTSGTPPRPNCDYTENPCLSLDQLCRCRTCQIYAKNLFDWMAASFLMPDQLSLLKEIDKWCSGENQVDDGEDAEDALRRIQDAIKAFMAGVSTSATPPQEGQ